MIITKQVLQQLIDEEFSRAIEKRRQNLSEVKKKAPKKKSVSDKAPSWTAEKEREHKAKMKKSKAKKAAAKKKVVKEAIDPAELSPEAMQTTVYDACHDENSEAWKVLNDFADHCDRQGLDASLLLQYAGDAAAMFAEEESDDYDPDNGSDIGAGGPEGYVDLALEKMQELLQSIQLTSNGPSEY